MDYLKQSRPESIAGILGLTTDSGANACYLLQLCSIQTEAPPIEVDQEQGLWRDGLFKKKNGQCTLPAILHGSLRGAQESTLMLHVLVDLVELPNFSSSFTPFGNIGVCVLGCIFTNKSRTCQESFPDLHVLILFDLTGPCHNIGRSLTLTLAAYA